MRDATLVDRWLSELPDAPRRVICRRFGLGGSTPAPIEEVSRELGVTLEEAYRLQRWALDKLRNTPPA